MVRGPARFPSKGACIYCGATNVELKDEHVVPLSLGGSHILCDASCSACEKITTKFEFRVARGLWGDARTAFSAPTRHKRKRPSHIQMPNEHGTGEPASVPAAEFPGGFLFYKMSQAGFLCGMPENVDLSKSWQMIIADDDERRQKFTQRYGRKVVLRIQHVPQDFGRLIAKIGYCNSLIQLNPSDFRSICLPHILGHAHNVSYVVGGTMDDPPRPETTDGYKLRSFLIGTKNHVLIMSTVRLYANLHSPEYHVVVGEAVGRENVARVELKLGTPDIIFPDSGRNTQKGAPHWFPRNWPPALWLGLLRRKV